MRDFLVALACASALAHTAAAAQSPPAPAPAPRQAASASCPTEAQLAAITVTRAARADAPGRPSPVDEHVVWLRGGIEVKGPNLRQLVDYASQRCTSAPRKVVLYLDGRPLPNLTPYPPMAPDSDTLKFELRRDESSRAVWTHILGGPLTNEREVQVSAGLADGYALPSTAKVTFRIFDGFWFVAWLLILLAITFVFFRMAFSSDMLRDSGAPPAQHARKAFSLGRTQAAFWFLLTLAAYAFIGLVTGDFRSTITKTVLALIGISAGTALGSSLLGPEPGSAAGPPRPAQASRGFLQDVLSDGGGVNFHRFQMFSWTLVLGVVFVHDVWSDLAMPDFDATLLGLLGLSAGTYLGLKTTTEKA